jgi:hypothetical protein
MRRARECVLKHVLEHGLVQRQIGDDLLQAAILLRELLDSPQLGQAQPAYFFFQCRRSSR